MSEFVACQNCGRRFFAENTECPYCRDAQIEAERAAPPGAETGRLFRILFSSFHMVLVGIAVLSLLAVRRTPLGPGRLVLAAEATAAVVLLYGSLQRRRWARFGAIVFIACNALLGLLGLLQRGQASHLVWGPGPLALLVFLLPFFTAQARERYHR